jgi:hypothetical protein
VRVLAAEAMTLGDSYGSQDWRDAAE